MVCSMEVKQQGLSNSKMGEVVNYLGLVRKIAKDYTGRELGYEDLVSEGIVGLIEALKKTKSTDNPRFSSLQSLDIARFISYANYWIRGAIKKALAKLEPALPLIEELIPADSKEDNQDRIRALERVLPFLDNKDQIIINHYFGLNGGVGKTLNEIAQELGISTVAVWKRKEKALKKLKKIMTSPIPRNVILSNSVMRSIGGAKRRQESPQMPLARKEYMKEYRKDNEKLQRQIRSWWLNHPNYYWGWNAKHPSYSKEWRAKNLQKRREYERNYKRDWRCRNRTINPIRNSDRSF